MRFKDGEAGQPSHTTTLIEIPASLGQALDTQERTAKPLALGCCAAQAARHDMEPHGHASAQASPPLQLGSARQALISVAQCCSPHVHFAGQAVLLQSGSAAGAKALDTTGGTAMLPASCGQALDTQERTAKPLALGCFAAQAARHDMEPHGHASAQASPPLQLGSARQALISVAQCCSLHAHL